MSAIQNPKIIVQQASPGQAQIVVKKGASGLTGVTPNAVAYGVTSTVLGYASGNPGEILQISAAGVPVFGDIDGGEY